MREIRLEPSDWLPPDGVPHTVLFMQLHAVAVADPADPDWVRVRGWWFPNDEAPDKEMVTFAVRFKALPEWVQALLPNEEAHHARR